MLVLELDFHHSAKLGLGGSLGWRLCVQRRVRFEKAEDAVVDADDGRGEDAIGGSLERGNGNGTGRWRRGEEEGWIDSEGPQ